jgi:hypothetical protein
VRQIARVSGKLPSMGGQLYDLGLQHGLVRPLSPPGNSRE